MKRKARASRSTYRAILSVRKERDEPSGLFVNDRFFQPSRKPENHPLLWWSLDALMLICLAAGIMLLMTSGFHVAVDTWFYPALALMCAGVTLVFHSRICARFWAPTAMILFLAYLAAVYWNQDAFLRGMGKFFDLMAYTIETTYAAEEEVAFPGPGGMDAQIFLLLIFFPAVIWLSLSLLLRNVFLMACLVIFPLLALLALCGAAKNTAALFLVMFGMMLGMASTQPKKQRRMWGGDKEALFASNRIRFQSIQKKTAAAVLAASIVLSIPGFLVVRPLLLVNLKSAEQMSMQLQSTFLNRMMKLLPELSAGQWRLNLEAIGGGVQDGALSSNEGYLLEGVEDLRLTVTQKPQQAFFLRGYVGKNYENGSWNVGSGATFDGASMNWNTEGSTRIYIQNLPFLRMAYALAGSAVHPMEIASRMAEFTAEPAQILVERLNANDSYTYVPYGVYLNDYYQVDAGDGAVAGQKGQEDRYFYFAREDLEEVLSTWNDLDNTANVLDRVEESYRAFCQTDCIAVPDFLESYQTEVRRVMADNKWKAQENLEDINAWIRQYLAENYSYQLIPPVKPEGADELQYFLEESRAGNSVHFASAAVMLYRMFGIPARYVVGYEIPAPLFTVQANGIYTATVQGDNSQAWAEIYVPGIGWTPKDMTPGVIGTYEEIGPGGEKIEAVIENTEAEETEVTLPEEALPAPEIQPEEAPEPRVEWTIGQIVGALLALVLSIGLIAAAALTVRRLSRTYGWNLFWHRSRQSRMLGIFQAFFRRMRHLGLPKKTDSQSEAFAAFCESELRKRDPRSAELLRPVLQRLYGSCFGAVRLDESDITNMRILLKASRKRKRKAR